MDAKPTNAPGVYSVPSIWRGPPGEVPEKIRKDGVDAKKIHVDPSRLVQFVNYAKPK